MGDSESEGYLNAVDCWICSDPLLSQIPTLQTILRKKQAQRIQRKKRRSEAWHLLQSMVFSVQKNRSTPNLNYERLIHHSWLHIICQECLPDQCLFWAGERPIEILLFALPTCLLTRVEHWNKQVPACWHYNKLRNTHLTLVLSKKTQLCLPEFWIQCCGVNGLSGTKNKNEIGPETQLQGGKCKDI